ncbi:Peptidyl-prolyl cis-trans isomerase FKBP5, partial [Eudyptes chrysolophus]
MTTDEATKSEGEVQAATLAERGEDITPARDRGVLKIIKRPGSKDESPMIGDKVYVHYKGKLANGKKFDSSRDRNEPFVFSLGKGEPVWGGLVCTASRPRGARLACRASCARGEAGDGMQEMPMGWDRCCCAASPAGSPPHPITLAGAGARATASPRCWGMSLPTLLFPFWALLFGRVFPPVGLRWTNRLAQGEVLNLAGKATWSCRCGGLPCSAGIAPSVYLQAKESWEMDTKEKLEQAAVVKEKGTMYFKEGKYLQAVIQYGKIVSWLEMEYGLSEKESKASDSFLLAAFLNLAMCYLKLREYAKAVECCDKALGLDQDNEKGLYRRGEARLLMNEFELAKCDFQKVLEVNPQNKAAKSQISVCQKKTKEHNERDRRIYANMFAKFAERDAKEAASKTGVEKAVEKAACEKGPKTPGPEGEEAEGHV